MVCRSAAIAAVVVGEADVCYYYLCDLEEDDAEVGD